MPAMAEPWQKALRSLADPPGAPGWNAAELVDLLGPQRSNAAVLVPLLMDTDLSDARVLFTVRTHALRVHAGEVCFPGGRSEPDDADAVATALRETQEETGIAPALVRPVGYLDAFETITGFVVTPVVGFVDSAHRLQPDPAEVEEVFDVPLAYILAPGNLTCRSVHWRGRARTIHELEWQGHRIWGATAAILFNLLQRLERVAWTQQ